MSLAFIFNKTVGWIVNKRGVVSWCNCCKISLYLRTQHIALVYFLVMVVGLNISCCFRVFLEKCCSSFTLKLELFRSQKWIIFFYLASKYSTHKFIAVLKNFFLLIFPKAICCLLWHKMTLRNFCCAPINYLT